MLHSTPSKVILHRWAVAVCVKALLLALFVAVGAEPALGAGTTETFTVSQALHSRFALGGSTQVYAGVGIVGGSGAATGTVAFYACAPSETVGGHCLGGTHFGTGTLDATSQTLSPLFMPTSGGVWCFRAAYLGSAAYAASESTTACTKVDPIAATTTIAGPTTVDLGNATAATATVRGPTWGPTATGTVAFAICPVDTTGSCTAEWTALGSSPLDADGHAVAPPFTPSLGSWCWHAGYGGDASYRPSQAFGACFEVVPVPEPGPVPVPGDGDSPDDDAAPPPDRRGPRHWTHADWPVDTLDLGGVSYSEEAARAILEGPTKGDAGNILARHLIAAKLDRATGALDASADAAIAEADALLAALGGPGAGTKMSKGNGGEVGRTIALIEGIAAGH